MKAGDTWDVPGVAFASRTGSENSIGPGMLLVSLIPMFLVGSRWIGTGTYTKSLWGACLKSDIVLDTIDLFIDLDIVLVAKCLVVVVNLLNIYDVVKR